MSCTIRVTHAQLLGDRENQEDALGLSSPADFDAKGLLALLSDGMGGMERGEVYSSMAVNAMLEAFAAAPADSDPGQGLRRMYAHLRQRAGTLRHGDSPEDGGATLVAALVRDDMLTFLSVGDSCIDLYRGGGLIRLNRPQTVGVKLDERAALGYIPAESAVMYSYRSALTNHVNATKAGPCDMCSSPIRLLPGDRILLSSDGLGGALTDPEIAAILATTEDAAHALISAAASLRKPRQDNASAVVLDILP
ncbi:MAG: protein phosphatase 2C domain-containing protein [Clostridia bacterium]|nr:protein phosphatase 2C domain-containing protein [Clostridia bacterium]